MNQQLPKLYSTVTIILPKIDLKEMKVTTYTNNVHIPSRRLNHKVKHALLMRKGVVSDEMLRGVENKRRSGDSRIGQPFKLLLNPWAGKRQPGELKHLSNQRKRKQKRFL